jgi:RNA polymerase sigma factor (sigma-70 family)
MQEPVRKGTIMTLTTEQQVALAQDGNQEAIATLCQAFTPLILKIVARYQGHHQAYEDLQQIGYVHFLEAIHDYKASYGVYFAYYAHHKIQGAIFSQVRKIERETSRRDDRQCHRHDEQEEEDVFAHLCAQNPPMEAHLLWQETLAPLSPRERLYLTAVIVQGYTMPEVAASCHVSLETVHTWRKRALAKLRRLERDEAVAR